MHQVEPSSYFGLFKRDDIIPEPLHDKFVSKGQKFARGADHSLPMFAIYDHDTRKFLTTTFTNTHLTQGGPSGIIICLINFLKSLSISLTLES